MADRRLGTKGFTVARSIPFPQRPGEVVPWLNHIVHATEGVAWTIIVLAIVVVLYFAADRAPPFAVLHTEPAQAMPGDHIVVRATVRRDSSRNCSAEFSRYLFDSAGTRFDLGHAIASSDMIATMDRQSPGRLAVSFRIPPPAEPGPARLRTVLEYTCNRTHKIMPIVVTTEMPLTVLPSP